MTRFNINKRDGFNLEATCLGWDIKFDDRKGVLTPWNLSALFDIAEITILKEESHDYAPNVLLVILKQIMTIQKILYRYRDFSNVKFKVKTSIGKPGKTTFCRVTRVYDGRKNELLAERYTKFAGLDRITGQTVSHSEEYIKVRMECPDFSSILQKQPIPHFHFDEKKFEYKTIIRYSDCDANNHTNQSVYIRSCIDCACVASTTQNLVFFTGDIARYPVEHFTIEYIGETFVGNEITVSLWQTTDNVTELMFLIEKSDDKSKVAFTKILFGDQPLNEEKPFSKM